MVDVLYRYPMNVSSSSQMILPSPYQRRYTAKKHTPMFFDSAPVAVSNKIRAIQARKTPVTLVPNDNEYTDIRPLNFGYTGGVTTSRTDFSVLTAERLVDRSKDIRLDRINKRNNARQSVLSRTSIAQQSSVGLRYQGSHVNDRKTQLQSNSTTNTSPGVRSSKNKSSSGGKMPEINRNRTREPLTDRENSLTPVEPQKKSILKTRTLHPRLHSSADRINQNNKKKNIVKIYDTDEDDYENILLDEDENDQMGMDEEFERYLESAISKCADWLIKYVFDQTVEDTN